MADELTRDELTWLRASLLGSTPMIPKAVAASLVAKGFMTKKPGGHVLSDAGRSWLVENGYVWVPKT